MKKFLLTLGVMALGVTGCSLPVAGAGDASPQMLAGPAFTALTPPKVCKGYVSLSIDDGPTPTSRELVDVLKNYRIPAIFFNTGEHSVQLPETVSLERTVAGVQFGNHSYDHPDLALLAPDLVQSQIGRTKAIQGAEVKFFRPPYGSSNVMVEQVAKANGMIEVLWTHDSKDFSALSAEQIVDQAQGMMDGGIVLLHDRPLTAQALPSIIASYYAKGLCFGKIAETPRAQAPTESPELTFYARAVAP